LKKTDLVIRVKVLTEDEGGRKTPFSNGYRGQFIIIILTGMRL